MAIFHSHLLQHEQNALLEGYKTLCGIDEVGRGPLAGPVVACALSCPFQLNIQIGDSKLLSAAVRLKSYQQLLCHPEVHFGIGVVAAMEIDTLNIHRATLLAMQRAYQHLAQDCDYALIDGIHKPSLGIETKTIVGGDQSSLLIGAASIVAKVTRDRYMQVLDLKQPHYGFAAHKGYGTKKHKEALAKYGPLFGVHRFSFAPLKRAK